MRTHSVFIVVLLSSVLAACQINAPRGEDSPWSRIPENSTLILHSPITILDQAVSAKIQDGEVMGFRPLYTFDPWCEIELWLRNQGEYVIQPGEFTVTRVVESTTTIIVGETPQLALSGQGTVQLGMGGGEGGGPGFVRNMTEMFLHSPNQPEVYLMTCSYDSGEVWIAAVEPLSIAQIRKTLDGLFSIRLARPGGQPQGAPAPP